MGQEQILVVGASGTVGSEILRQLTDKGFRRRGTTSKLVKPSNELVTLNLTTGEGVHAAFDGVDRAFFLSPPGFADQHSMLSPLIQEAKRRGLKKVVLMTAMGANANDSSAFRRAEIELVKSGLNYNIIRPNWFMQNFHTFWIQGILQQNKILLPAGTAKVSFIDARDISSVAATLLTSDKWDKKDFDLTGPTPVDHAEVASAISKVSGRNVTYQEVSPSDFKQGLLKAGLPEGYVDFLVLIFGFLKEGYSARLTNSVKEITGHAPRSLENYTRDFKAAWQK